MIPDYATSKEVSQVYGKQLQAFVGPLVGWLDAKIDKRLVRTFVLALQAIVSFRHNSYGLLLSELGGYITSPSQAPAGTKRLSNLLRSAKWRYRLIERFLWQLAHERVKQLQDSQQDVWVVWDESVVEKPESSALEGLCPVRSSRAERLKRYRRGYARNLPRPIFVPGMQWISLLVLGNAGAVTLAAMRWWTNRGKYASDKRSQEGRLLRLCCRWWGHTVVHIWDRGFASTAWLERAFHLKIRFIVRWPSRYKLIDALGERNTWRITRGKRSLDQRLIWDARRRCRRKIAIYYTPVRHPAFDQPLTLVVSRRGAGQSPWYLLTNEPVTSLDQAWRVVFAYMRRWQVETTFRFSKSELAMQAPRLWRWHTRLKLLLMVSVVYAFLLSLLHSALHDLLVSLLRLFCHRTGKRHRTAAVPLYRLRSALSRLWLSHPFLLPQNSG